MPDACLGVLPSMSQFSKSQIALKIEQRRDYQHLRMYMREASNISMSVSISKSISTTISLSHIHIHLYTYIYVYVYVMLKSVLMYLCVNLGSHPYPY